MSGKSSYKGQPQPKYLNDFSKALANEVRILLQEVGELRDERRQLQYEIAELMAVKSKHGAGGEYAPDWKPKPNMPEPPPPPPEPEPEMPVQPAKPAWRTVTVRPDKKERHTKRALPAPASAPAIAPAPPPPPQLPAWAQWKPNPSYAPAPRAAPAPAMPIPQPPPRAAGLFGPKTPPPH